MIDIPDFVYPKDINGNSLCPRCNKLVPQCNCPSIELAKPKTQSIRPSIRLDRSGRNGKVVTLITISPDEPIGPFGVYLKDLAKTLKIKTGSGGTFILNENEGTIELQGDHKEFVIEFFRKKQ